MSEGHGNTICSCVQDTPSCDLDATRFAIDVATHVAKLNTQRKEKADRPITGSANLRDQPPVFGHSEFSDAKVTKSPMLHLTERLTSSGSLTFFFCILHKIWGKIKCYVFENHKEWINFNRCQRIRLFTVHRFSVRALSVTSLFLVSLPHHYIIPETRPISTFETNYKLAASDGECSISTKLREKIGGCARSIPE